MARPATGDSELAITWRASPNCDERGGAPIDLLVLHYTGMASAEAALDWLCSPQSKVSSHYFVDESGAIVQSVDESRRAWHAGVSSWRGRTDLNARSIGIEIANSGHEFGYRDFPRQQVDAVIRLCRSILSRHAIAPRNIVAHSDIAPTRKQDPGERFPWRELFLAGIGHWVEPAPLRDGGRLSPGDVGAEVERLQRQLSAYGYAVPLTGEFDEQTFAVVTALQRHFRQARVDGIADASTRDTLERLLDGIAGDVDARPLA